MSLLNNINKVANEPVVVSYLANKVMPISALELQQETNKLTAIFNALDSGAIAFQLDNTPAWLVVDAATSAANKVAVPIAHFFSQQQTQYVLAQCGAQFFISDMPRYSLGKHSLSVTLFEHYTLYIYQLDAIEPVDYFTGTQKITFTSGSTGEPKGVCLSTQSQMQVAQSLCEQINISNPVHLCLLPLPVLLENIAGVYAPLLSGGCVHLMPLNELGFVGSGLKNPNKLIGAIDSVKPNTLILVPELLTCLVAFAKQGWQPPKSLKFIAVGGARVSESLILTAREYNLPVYQGYGLSEAASVVSLNTPNYDDINSAGEVLKHVETKVENDELFIKGALFLGYLNQAPHNPNTWYATGDLVSKRNNKLYIKGRVKNLIITSMGRNVSAEWPESLILSQSAIQQAVVFGESQPFLSTLIYAAPEFSDEQLKAHLKTVNQQLPDYAQIKKWHRLAQPLNEQQGLLTANNRPKRAAISQHYSPIFKQFYRLGEVIHE